MEDQCGISGSNVCFRQKQHFLISPVRVKKKTKNKSTQGRPGLCFALLMFSERLLQPRLEKRKTREESKREQTLAVSEESTIWKAGTYQITRTPTTSWSISDWFMEWKVILLLRNHACIESAFNANAFKIEQKKKSTRVCVCVPIKTRSKTLNV